MAAAQAGLVHSSNNQNDLLARVWTYTTADDSKATCYASAYWAGSGVKVGDFIMVSASDGGVILYVTVVSASASTVTKFVTS